MAKPWIVRQLPNAITLTNLAIGFVGILLAGEGHLTTATWCMVAAMVADFFDGMAARLLKVSSPIGGDLDSLADMVSFGVLPGLIGYYLLSSLSPEPHWLAYLAMVVPLAAAVRLAVFNNDTTQSTGFKGVPTPLSALVMGSLPFIAADHPDYVTVPVVLATCLLLAALNVSRLPLIALKFTTFAFRPNAVKYLFLLLSAISLVLLHFLAVPVIFGLYLALSLANRSKKG